jgi:hypothetical protein
VVAVPVTQREAFAFVAQHHRTHHAPRGAIVCIGAAEAEEIIGVVVVGRPVARGNQDGFTAEVTRLTVLEGHPNACSFLYGAAWRAVRAMGYRRLITYTLDTEPGTSLIAAGFRLVAAVRGRSWHTPSRPRVDVNPTQGKLRFAKEA